MTDEDHKDKVERQKAGYRLRLRDLNRELERWGAVPTFSLDAINVMSRKGLREAVKQTESDLLRLSKITREEM
jgi:hypothetical protein